MPINNFLLPGAKFTPAYEVANSCRFNGDAHLSKTPGSAGSTTTGTLSWWMKYDVATDSGGQYIYTNKDGSNKQFIVRFHNKALKVDHWNGSGYDFQKATSMLFRDPSAWYHICIKIDTGNGTAANRIKLFVNGTNVGWDADDDTVAEDFDGNFFINASTQIGDTIGDGADFKGYLAEFVGIDGTAYDADSFGEFNSDSPTIWQPIDVSGLTFGTNGFWLDFEDSSNLGNDKNGGTDWSETSLAASDSTTDTPTNNWCVMQPLDNHFAGNTYTEGNTKVVTPTGATTWNTGTFGVSTGKWYWEVNYSAKSNTNAAMIGIAEAPTTSASNVLGNTSGTVNISYYTNGYKYVSGSSSSYGDTYDSGTIIGVALDLDNSKLYFSKDGTWQDSGDPTSGATGTGAIGITAAASTTNGFYFPAVGDFGTPTTTSITFLLNFGNPAYSISSGNADANGYGNFEYAVPTNYYSLCTKNLAEYG